MSFLLRQHSGSLRFKFWRRFVCGACWRDQFRAERCRGGKAGDESAQANRACPLLKPPCARYAPPGSPQNPTVLCIPPGLRCHTVSWQTHACYHAGTIVLASSLTCCCYYYYYCCYYTLFLPRGKVRRADKLQLKAAIILPLVGLARSKQDPVKRGHGAQ